MFDVEPVLQLLAAGPDLLECSDVLIDEFGRVDAEQRQANGRLIGLFRSG